MSHGDALLAEESHDDGNQTLSKEQLNGNQCEGNTNLSLSPLDIVPHALLYLEVCPMSEKANRDVL